MTRQHGPWHEALGQLASALMGSPGVQAKEGGLLTVASLRVRSEVGELLITVRETAEGKVEFLAPAVDAVPYRSALEVIGTGAHIAQVAGIVRRRLSVR